MKLLSNNPVGTDLFEGKSQERIATLICNSFEDARNAKRREGIASSSVIGLEGEWGSGKSNVIKILENKLKDIKGHKYCIFNFDLWGRQQDIQRKVILEELAAFVKEECGIDKTEEVRRLVVKKTESEAKLSTRGVWGRLVPICLGGLIPLLLSASGILSKPYPKVSIGLLWMVGMVAAISVVWGLGAVLKRKDALVSLSEFLGNMLQITTKGDGLPKVQYQYQYNVTVTDFTVFMVDLSTELLNKNMQLVLVFDNMDRLDSEKVREFWSSIHILFAERKESCLANVHIIVPFDRTRVRDSFGEGDGDDYINKTFDVVYRVAPPILKDWKKYFVEKLREASLDEKNISEKDIEDTSDMFDLLYARATVLPRVIIGFINHLSTMHNVLSDDIPLKYIALYLLSWRKSRIEDGLSFEDQILSGKFIEDVYVKNMYLDSQEAQRCLTAIVYQVSLEKGGEILLAGKLRKALNAGDSKTIATMSEDAAFHNLYKRVVLDRLNLRNATLALSGVSEVYRKRCWNELYERHWDEFQKMQDQQGEVADYQVMLLCNIDPWRRYLKSLYDSLVKVKADISIRVSFIKKVSNALDGIGRSVMGVLDRQQVEAESFVELLNVAGRDYKLMNWQCDLNRLDEYVAELVANDLEQIKGVAHLDRDKAVKLEKSRAALKDVDLSGEMSFELVEIVLSVLECIRKDGYLVGTCLGDEAVEVYANGEISSTEELSRAVAFALSRDEMSVVENEKIKKFLTDDDAVKAQTFKEVLLKYLSHSGMLMRIKQMQTFALYLNAAKLVLAEQVNYNLENAYKIMGSLADIVTVLGAEANSILRSMPNIEWDKMPIDRMKSVLNGKTLFVLRKSDHEKARTALRRVQDVLQGTSPEHWKEALSMSETDWNVEAAIAVGFKWPGFVSDIARGILRDVVDGEIDAPDANMWGEFVEAARRQKMGVKAWFKECKNRIVANSRQIAVDEFLFIAPFVFRYGDVGKGREELFKLLPDETVRQDDDCKRCMAEHQDAIRKMFAKSEDQEDFVNYIQRELSETPDSSLQVFKDLLPS